jgi:N-acetyl-anhydromuramyl-L-alanine amidase AmpD
MAEGGHTEGYNTRGIAICVEGDYSVEKTMPDVQRQAIVELAKDILSRHPKLKIVGHKDLNKDTACPGKYFPMEDIQNLVADKPVEEKKEEKKESPKRDFIAEAQAYMNRCYNSKLDVDGIWGPKTNAAVLKVMQKYIKADPDGIWGPETYSKCIVVGKGDEGTLVVVIQVMSAKFGGNLEIDGEFGKLTDSFIRKFQKEHKLDADGLVGKRTFKELFA